MFIKSASFQATTVTARNSKQSHFIKQNPVLVQISCFIQTPHISGKGKNNSLVNRPMLILTLELGTLCMVSSIEPQNLSRIGPARSPSLTHHSTVRLLQHPWLVRYLHKSQQTFTVKGQIVNVLGLWPFSLCYHNSTWLLNHKSNHRQNINKWLCYGKTLFTKQAVGQIWPTCCGLPIPNPDSF